MRGNQSGSLYFRNDTPPIENFTEFPKTSLPKCFIWFYPGIIKNHTTGLRGSSSENDAYFFDGKIRLFCCGTLSFRAGVLFGNEHFDDSGI